MSNPLPTIVLVHGAWHKPTNYQSYITDLESQGFTVHCPLLPTCTGTLSPTASTADDIAHVRSVLESCIERGERILLIMHSYGGIVGTGAAQDLELATRKAADLPGGIIHLLYLCAYILTPGQTVWDLVVQTGVDKLWPQLVDTATDGSIMLLDPGLAFFSGLEEQAVVDKALETLVRFPGDTMRAVTVGDGWRRVPVTYVRATRDNALIPAYQDIMLERVRGEGVGIEVLEFDTHHSIWVSLPREMVEVALKAAGDERNLE